MGRRINYFIAIKACRISFGALDVVLGQDSEVSRVRSWTSYCNFFAACMKKQQWIMTQGLYECRKYSHHSFHLGPSEAADFAEQ